MTKPHDASWPAFTLPPLSSGSIEDTPYKRCGLNHPHLPEANPLLLLGSHQLADDTDGAHVASRLLGVEEKSGLTVASPHAGPPSLIPHAGGATSTWRRAAAARSPSWRHIR